MTLFVLTCLDKPGGLDLRMTTREAHLAYTGAHPDVVKLGGPFLSETGEMIGSLIIVDVENLAAARAFSDNDPYTQAGVFESVEIRGYRIVRGALG